MYNSLLTSGDGGLREDAALTTRGDVATIALGLGGTGIHCLCNLKNRLSGRVKTDDLRYDVPGYEHIRFLAIDSDFRDAQAACERASGRGGLDFREELFSIEPVGAYVPTREAGRQLLVAKSRQLAEKLGDMARRAVNGLNAPTLNVHIFAGLGGATGGGAFLELCYIVRKTLENLGLNAKIYGYFFLPEIFDAVAQNFQHGRMIARIRAYSYAALTELDRAMALPGGGDRPPVDLCHLISGIDMNAVLPTSPFNRAMDAVAEYVTDSAVRYVSELRYERPPLLSDMADALNAIRHGPLADAAERKYCAIGSAADVTPHSDARNYIIAKVFERFDKIAANAPTTQEVTQFASQNFLTLEALLRELTRGIDLDVPEPPFVRREVKSSYGLIEGWLSQHMDIVNSVTERNYDVHAAELHDCQSLWDVIGKHPDAIVSRICRGLCELASDSGRGLHYAAAMLYSASNRNLTDVARGLIKEMNERISQLSERCERLYEEYRNARRDFEIRAGRRNYNNYKSAATQLCRRQGLLIAYKKASALIGIICEQLRDIDERFMRELRDIEDGLSQAFAANHKFLSSVPDDAQDYERRMIALRDLRPELDAIVAGKDIPGMYREFVTRLSDTNWRRNRRDEYTAIEMVSDFFDRAFGAYTPKTMSECLRGDTLIAAYERATPLFWLSPAFDAGETARFGHIAYPIDCNDAQNAAHALCAARPGMTEKPTDEPMRIATIRCCAGLPLSAYEGLALCKADYDAATRDGLYSDGGHM